MAGYATGALYEPKEEEEEENADGKSQAAGDEPYGGKSRLGKRKRCEGPLRKGG